MNESAFEQRLRRGLASAAEALPEHAAPQPEPARPGGPGRRPFLAVAAAAVAVLSGVAVVTALNARSEDKAAVTANEGEGSGAPGDAGSANGQVPGQAVLVDQEIRFFDSGGEQTGVQTIEPLLEASGGASSDLAGGWVVCGPEGYGEPDLPTTERDSAAAEGSDPLPEDEVDPRESPSTDSEPFIDAEDLDSEVAAGMEQDERFVEQIYWFPEGGEPVHLVEDTICYDTQVTDSAEGPTVVYGTEPAEPDPSDEWAGPVLEATVLTTGETYDVPVELPPEAMMSWSISTDRVLFPDEQGVLEMHDLDTGEQLDLPEIYVGEWADLALAPDGRSVAVAEGDPVEEGPLSLTVYDLETGDVLLATEPGRRSTGEEIDVSYDGTTLAVGSAYPDDNLVEVIDIESEERYNLDASGLPL